jgi:hypothetical protein
MKKADPNKPRPDLTDRLAEVKGGARAVVIEIGDTVSSTCTTNELANSGG